MFHELQNTGCHLDRLPAKTMAGLATRIIAKITAHLFKHILKTHYYIQILTFQSDQNEIDLFTEKQKTVMNLREQASKLENELLTEYFGEQPAPK